MRKGVIFWLSLLTIICLAGCGKQTEDEISILNRNEMDLSAVVVSGRGEACITGNPYEAIAEKYESVIYGEVVNVEYVTAANGNIYTAQTIRVSDTLAGSDLSGEIRVWKNGGYSTISDFLESYDDDISAGIRTSFERYTDADLDTKYIAQFEREDIPSDSGMKFVLYLELGSNDFAEYHVMYDHYGEFLEVKDGQFFTTSSGITYEMYREKEYLGNLDEDQVQGFENELLLTTDEILNYVRKGGR